MNYNVLYYIIWIILFHNKIILWAGFIHLCYVILFRASNYKISSIILSVIYCVLAARGTPTIYTADCRSAVLMSWYWLFANLSTAKLIYCHFSIRMRPSSSWTFQRHHRLEWIESHTVSCKLPITLSESPQSIIDQRWRE